MRSVTAISLLLVVGLLSKNVPLAAARGNEYTKLAYTGETLFRTWFMVQHNDVLFLLASLVQFSDEFVYSSFNYGAIIRVNLTGGESPVRIAGDTNSPSCSEDFPPFSVTDLTLPALLGPLRGGYYDSEADRLYFTQFGQMGYISHPMAAHGLELGMVMGRVPCVCGNDGEKSLALDNGTIFSNDLLTTPLAMTRWEEANITFFHFEYRVQYIDSDWRVHTFFGAGPGVPTNGAEDRRSFVAGRLLQSGAIMYNTQFYICDTELNVIDVVDLETGVARPFIGSPSVSLTSETMCLTPCLNLQAVQLSQPYALAPYPLRHRLFFASRPSVGQDDHVYVVDLREGSMRYFWGGESTAGHHHNGPATDSGISALMMGTDNMLYVATARTSGEEASVYRVRPEAFTDTFSPSSSPSTSPTRTATGTASPRVCSSVEDCNGHAAAVSGTVVSGCNCTCSIGFDGASCGVCAPMYENYPSCTAIACTNDDNCNSHAGPVSGVLVSGCTCICFPQYTGAACGSCSKRFTGYPECFFNTNYTLSDTATPSFSPSVSPTLTNSVSRPSASISARKSLSLTVSSPATASPTSSAASSLSLSHSRSLSSSVVPSCSSSGLHSTSHTSSHSATRSKSGFRSRSLSSRPTSSPSVSSSPTSVTLSSSVSVPRSWSATQSASPLRSSSLSKSASTSPSAARSVSNSLSASRAVSASHTPTATDSHVSSRSGSHPTLSLSASVSVSGTRSYSQRSSSASRSLQPPVTRSRSDASGSLSQSTSQLVTRSPSSTGTHSPKQSTTLSTSWSKTPLRSMSFTAPTSTLLSSRTLTSSATTASASLTPTFHSSSLESTDSYSASASISSVSVTFSLSHSAVATPSASESTASLRLLSRTSSSILSRTPTNTPSARPTRSQSPTAHPTATATITPPAPGTNTGSQSLRGTASLSSDLTSTKSSTASRSRSAPTQSAEPTSSLSTTSTRRLSETKADSISASNILTPTQQKTRTVTPSATVIGTATGPPPPTKSFAPTKSVTSTGTLSPDRTISESRSPPEHSQTLSGPLQTVSATRHLTKTVSATASITDGITETPVHTNSTTATCTASVQTPPLFSSNMQRFSATALAWASGPRTLEVAVVGGVVALESIGGCSSSCSVATDLTALLSVTVLSASCNATYILISVAAQPSVRQLHSSTISRYLANITFSSACTRPAAPILAGHPHVQVEVINDVSAPAATVAPAVVSATTLTASTVGTTSALMGSPAVAAQASRMSLVVSLARCEPDPDDVLDFSTSPTGVQIGHTSVRAQVGAAVMNTVLQFLLFVVHLLVATVIHLCHGRRRPFVSALAAARFPGLQIVFALFFMQPTVANCITVMQVSGMEDPLWSTVSFVCLCLWQVPLAAVIYWMRASVFTAERVDPPNTPRPSMFDAFVFGRGKWMDKQKGDFVRYYGLMFADYADKKHWWVLAELVFSLACGVLDGMLPPNRRACSIMSIFLVISNFSYFFAHVWFRPFEARLNTILFIFSSFLQFIGGVAVCAFVMNEDAEWGLYVGTVFPLAATYALLAKSLFDNVNAVYHFTRKKWLRHKRRDMYIDRHIERVLGPESMARLRRMVLPQRAVVPITAQLMEELQATFCIPVTVRKEADQTISPRVPGRADNRDGFHSLLNEGWNVFAPPLPLQGSSNDDDAEVVEASANEKLETAPAVIREITTVDLGAANCDDDPIFDLL